MKTGRKADRKMIDKRECRKHVDPGLRMRRDNGLLCAGPVDYTVVNGKVVVREGRLTGIDEEQAVREAQTCCQAYLNR